MPPLANIQTAAFTKLYKFQPCQEVTCFNYFYLNSLVKFFGPCIVLLSYWSSSFEGPRIETGRVYQKFIRNGRRTSYSDFCPDWVFWTRFSSYKVDGQKYDDVPHPSPRNPYKCLHRCQKNCTKNLVPLAEAKFIFEMTHGTKPTSLYSV